MAGFNVNSSPVKINKNQINIINKIKNNIDIKMKEVNAGNASYTNTVNEQKFDNNIVADIIYDENGEIVEINYYYNNNGLKEPIDIFGNYNVDNKQFGGNQMDFSYHTDELLKDDLILDMLKQYYPDATMEDYEYYLNALTNVGCGYTAFINSIFKIYEGREAEFEQTFGFPMYNVGVDGTVDFNYEYLILDLFNYTWGNRGYSIQELYGDIGTNATDGAVGSKAHMIIDGTNSGINTDAYNRKHYDNNVSNYIQWFGEKTGIVINRTSYTKAKISQEFGTVLKQGTDEWKEYLISHGQDPEGTFIDIPVASEDSYRLFFEQALSQGTVYIGISNIEMYPKGGGAIARIDQSPGHAMIVVGLNEDGLLVSSWGEEYIIEWSSLTEAGYVDVNVLQW